MEPTELGKLQQKQASQQNLQGISNGCPDLYTCGQGTSITLHQAYEHLDLFINSSCHKSGMPYSCCKLDMLHV